MSETLLSDPSLARYRAALDELYDGRLDRVVLFGSRGDGHPDPDYDVTVFLRAWLNMNYVVTTGDRHPRESTRKRVCARNDNLSGVQVPQISERRIVRALDGRLRRVIGAGRVPRAGDAFGDIPRHQIWRVPRRHEIALARPASLVRQPRSGFAQKAGTLGGAFAELADGAPGESPTLLVAERSLCRIAMKRSCRSPSSAEVEDLRLKQTRLVSLNGPGNEGRVIHLTA